MSRLKQKYQKEIVPVMTTEFKYQNIHQVPKVSKVVISAGVGRAAGDTKLLDTSLSTLRKISGQQPVSTVARQSVAGFKLREGNKIGASVTLRGNRMYDFLDRLVAVTLPRVRDFHGISQTAFDSKGNYSLGVSDPGIFPELTYEEAAVGGGMQVNVVTSAQTDDEARRLLTLMGFPFRKEN